MAFIRTMLGDIAPEKLGFTYSHEHIVCRPQHWVDRNADDLLLDDPAKGLIVEHNIWREMIWQQENSVLCVAADSYYEAADYIRDYDEFLKTVQAKG